MSADTVTLDHELLERRRRPGENSTVDGASARELDSEAEAYVEFLLSRLTERQRRYVYRGPLLRSHFDQLVGMAIGETLPECAQRLGMNSRTARMQSDRARQRLLADDRGHAVRLAFWMGLINLDDLLAAIGRPATSHEFALEQAPPVIQALAAELMPEDESDG